MHSNNRDRFLLEAVLAGDEEAFGRLYDKYVVKIYRFVSFRVGSKESAEDLTAEIFFKNLEIGKERQPANRECKGFDLPHCRQCHH